MRRGVLHEVKVFWTIWCSCPVTIYQFQSDLHSISDSMVSSNQYGDQGNEKQLENTEIFYRNLDGCFLSADRIHEYILDQWLQSFWPFFPTNINLTKWILILTPKITSALDFWTKVYSNYQPNTCSENTTLLKWRISPLSQTRQPQIIYTNNEPAWQKHVAQLTHS